MFFIPHPAVSRRAFTIAELIIVMMIIVLLIAILLPALSSARARARRVAGQSQLTAISAAIEAYSVQFNGATPALGSAAKQSTYAQYGQHHPETLALTFGLIGGIVAGNGDLNVGAFGTGESLEPFAFENDNVGAGVFSLAGGTIGESYGAFYSPKPDELKPVTGAFTSTYASAGLLHIVDNFQGMPILYYSGQRNSSNLAAWTFATDPTAKFFNASNGLILGAPALTSGGNAYKQRDATSGSVIDQTAAGSTAVGAANLAKVVGNWKISGAALGNAVVVNAGDDGIYFAKDQPDRKNINSGTIVDQEDFESFDDLVGFAN